MTSTVIVFLNILDCDFLAEIEYRVTSKGCPEQGPSYSSGGEPAEPPEWEIEEISLRDAADHEGESWVELPEWLYGIIADSSKVAQAIIEEIADEAEADLESMIREEEERDRKEGF